MNGKNVLQRTPIAAAAGIALLALILAALILLPAVALADRLNHLKRNSTRRHALLREHEL